MPGINQLGGAQVMMQSDTGGKEVLPQSDGALMNAVGVDEAPADAVQATTETPEQEPTNPDERGPQNGSRRFAQLAKKNRRPDPFTGDLISLGSQSSFPVNELESPKLSLVATDEEVSKKDMLEKALVDIFARPAKVPLGPRPIATSSVE